MPWRTTQKKDIESLSEWVQALRPLILKGMKVLSRSMSVNATSVFEDPDVAKTKPQTTLFLAAKRFTSNFIIRGRRRK